MSPAKDLNVTIAAMAEQVGQVRTDVREIKDRLERNYVTMDRFVLVERVVYGLVALILVGVIAALLRVVVLS